MTEITMPGHSRRMPRPRRDPCVPACLVVLFAGAFLAGAPPADGADDTSLLDRIWDSATLYENADNPFVQQFSLSGRLQADAAFFDAGPGTYERLTWRRLRFGVKTSLLRGFLLHTEVDLDLNDTDIHALENTYLRMTDAYIAWSGRDANTLKLGKQSAPFTLDGATSSKQLLTLERSPIAENIWFPAEYFTGVVGLGEIGDWSYHAGLYSSSGDDEFGSLDSGYFGLLSVGCHADALWVRVDYVYNDPDYSGDVGTRDLRQVGSLVARYSQGRAGIWTDLSLGDGIDEQGDLIGLQVMPYYDLTDRHQVVLRYVGVTSSRDNGVRHTRYESRIESGRVDDLHEFFLGFNWYFRGHDLKWQNGVEFTRANDAPDDGGAYEGWGFTSGFRIGW